MLFLCRLFSFFCFFFFFSSRRRHTRFDCDWSSDVCSSDLYSRRVDHTEVSLRCLQDCVNGVARRSGYWRNDDAIFAEYAIQQGRLPDIRPANYRQPQFAALFGLRGGGRVVFKCIDNAIEQIADADSLFGRDRKNVVEPEAVKLSALAFLFGGVSLVRGDQDWFSSRTQQRRELFVKLCNARTGIDDPNEQLRVVDRHSRLLQNVCRNHRVVVRHNAARIDQGKLFSRPLNFPVNAIARDARLVAHDGAPLADKTIEERGFAYVGTPNDCDLWRFRFHELP